MGIAELCVAEMISEGLTKEQAYNRIFLMDIDGLITKNRCSLSDLHKPYAKDLPGTTSLLEASIFNLLFSHAYLKIDAMNSFI